MRNHTKLKLRSERGSLHGGQLSSYIPDSSFSNDDLSSIDCSHSMQRYSQSYAPDLPIPPILSSAVQLGFLPTNVGYPILCMNVHNQLVSGQFYPSQAFPLALFKTKECSTKTKHDHKQCPYFHSLKDKRRMLAPNLNYEPEMCPKHSPGCICPKYDSCAYSHNTVEQFYHPKKYRTKLCSKALRDGADKCEYGNFCSFAHNETELQIPLLHRMDKTQDFFRFNYKTVYCPFTHVHEKSTCEYAHNVQDFRRNPKTVPHYKPEVCKKWNMKNEITKYEDGGCNYNEACDKCHGWKELEYHPKYFKTKACEHGEKCPRKHCGYLHPNENHRKAEELSESNFHESNRESRTSSSVRPRGTFRASDSQYSSSKEDMLHTFNSTCQSKFLANDSTKARNADDDRKDFNSLLHNNRSSRNFTRTDFGLTDDDDCHFAKGTPRSPDSTNISLKGPRKFSVETVIGGSERGFRVSFESSSIHEFSKGFASPNKMLESYGPKSCLDQKSRPSSPCLSALALKSEPDDEDLPAHTDYDGIDHLLSKCDLSEDGLISSDLDELGKARGLLQSEVDRLKAWREKVLDENEKRREEGILLLIDDIQDKCFKKF